MKLVLITGMSGAGKSVALKTLEDCGFEAIDNIPLAFLPAVAASVVEAGAFLPAAVAFVAEAAGVEAAVAAADGARISR